MINPKVSVFSLPLASWQQKPSVRVEKYDARAGHKRRKSGDHWDDEDHDEGDTDVDTGREVTYSQGPSLVLSPDEAHQYRIAGLPFDQELPSGNFPHANAVDQERKRPEKHHIEELSDQSPPIFIPGSETTDSTLHLRHLGVLTTILHRCILEGNFARAGRAWGMLLRERIGGNLIDIRLEGRWAIGAEILFRQHPKELRAETPETISISDKPLFTRQGFEAAKAYYEGLIIQYPYRKHAPNSVSSVHFYPAMFSLWIYVVDTESMNAREAAENEEDDAASDNLSETGDVSMSDSIEDQGRTLSARIARIRSKELNEALEIAARMDELLISPPYSDSPELLQLRGMVALWIGDLLVSSLPEETTNIHEGLVESSQVLLARREADLAKEKRETEKVKASELFEKAKMRRRGANQSVEGQHM
ncbi:hypothetical protein PISL3812_03800 [Talaromyces islandicus]|uniref:RNA polymerase I-specific transcription initiation factor rrn11 n=1 Tax=Talaromyces islandicus TaxID=28573 RepID=A0A0U1LTS1_TALIS|nr:hypothetical protein PISL3812_03800 [Talaromyces islandicus]